MWRARQAANSRSGLAVIWSFPPATLPDVAWSMPAIRFSRVVLPDPEGPIMATNGWSGILSETSSRAFTSNASRLYVLVTCSNSTALLFIISPSRLHVSLLTSAVFTTARLRQPILINRHSERLTREARLAGKLERIVRHVADHFYNLSAIEQRIVLAPAQRHASTPTLSR